MTHTLTHKKVAILVANGFEQVELTQPLEALQAAGVQVHIVSPEQEQVQGWHHYDKGDYFAVDVPLEQAKAENYDALVLPGGTVNPDQLRVNPQAIALIKDFATAGKWIAAVCHGPGLLAEADLIQGCDVTSWPSLQTDLRNAGANWVDREVAIAHQQQLITSRNPDDLPAFSEALIGCLNRVPVGA